MDRILIKEEPLKFAYGLSKAWLEEEYEQLYQAVKNSDTCAAQTIKKYMKTDRPVYSIRMKLKMIYYRVA